MNWDLNFGNIAFGLIPWVSLVASATIAHLMFVGFCKHTKFVDDESFLVYHKLITKIAPVFFIGTLAIAVLLSVQTYGPRATLNAVPYNYNPEPAEIVPSENSITGRRDDAPDWRGRFEDRLAEPPVTIKKQDDQ